MSGVLKAVGKVFKSVVKVVKKIAVPLLVVGAVVLTGGAALGALPAVGSVLGGLGLSAGVTTALTSAVVGAGYGAMAGGVMAGVTGKNIIKGAISGGVTGAISGGVLAGVGAPLAGPAGKLASAASSAGTPTVSGMPGLLGDASQNLAGSSVLPGPSVAAQGSLVPSAASQAADVASGAMSAGGAPAAAGNGLLNFVNKNPVVAGQMISGLGTGISNYATASAAAGNAREARDYTAANYGTGGGNGLLSRSEPDAAATPPLVSPGVRFDPMSYGGQYAFDPALGRVVFVPNGK